MSTNDPSITAVFAAAQKPARDLLAALKVGGNDMTPDFSALDTTAKQSFALAVEGKHEFTVANEVRVIFAVDEDGMEGTVEPLLLPERFAELLGRERAEYTPPCVDCDKAPCDCHDNDHPGYAAWEAAE